MSFATGGVKIILGSGKIHTAIYSYYLLPQLPKPNLIRAFSFCPEIDKVSKGGMVGAYFLREVIYMKLKANSNYVTCRDTWGESIVFAAFAP